MAATPDLPRLSKDQPIDLVAASSDFDYKKNALLFKQVKITQGPLKVEADEASATGLNFEDSDWTLKGNVKITVPDGMLTSSDAKVMFRKNQISRAEIRGAPAEFEQLIKETGKLAKGRANSIVYDVQADTVRMAGDAWLTDGENVIRGETLIYDIAGQRVAANPGGTDPGGVRITINPRSQDKPAGKETSRRQAQGRTRAAEAGDAAVSVLRAESLGKEYRKRRVVSNLSLEVRSGEVVGLLGPNGAGKTTAFYMIVGLVPCDEGRIWLDDREVTGLPMYRRARLGLGYLPQEASVFRKLTVEDNIRAILEVREDLDDGVEREAALESLLEELHIGHIRSSIGMSLSGGERRRVEIARALAAEPRFILLDEPFAGVDPISVDDIQRIIRHLSSRDIGVLITDHNVRETLGICSRAYIVSSGSVIASGSAEEILANPQVREVYLGQDFRL